MPPVPVNLDGITDDRRVAALSGVIVTDAERARFSYPSTTNEKPDHVSVVMR
jgi:hypothetical protein